MEKQVLLSLFPLLAVAALALLHDQDAVTAPTPRAPDTQGEEAMYYSALEDGSVRCELCFRNCVISPGRRGFCGVRENRGGVLYTLVYGQPSSLQIDPVEKEPQHHYLPGTEILCLGTVGCNFTCTHCHNWQLSQARPGDLRVYDLPPESVVEMALSLEIPTISFTYNDPVVMYEYLLETARIARENGVRVLWHSNGSLSPAPLKRLLAFTDAVTIDLKGFSDRAYSNSEALLQPTLTTLDIIASTDVWLEIVYLVIPTVNDDPDEIRQACRWIADNLGTDVPVHFSRFFPSYRLTRISPTPIPTLEAACAIAGEEGLEFVTIGNAPGHSRNSTYCSGCGEVLILRSHFSVFEVNITDGRCDGCGVVVPGVWQ